MKRFLIGKYLFYLTNTLFFCAGIVLLAVGTEYKWYLDDYYLVTPDHQYYLNVAPSGCIVIGAAITFIGLFGYWGVAQENNCILNAYFMMLLTLLISQICLGSMGIVQVRNSDGVLEEEIERTTANLFSKYETDDVAKSTIDYYQQHLTCCGVEGPGYWNGSVPNTCCSCNCKNCSEAAAFREGCAGHILYAFQKCVRVVGGVLIGLSLMEFFGMILSCYLITLITHPRKYLFAAEVDD